MRIGMMEVIILLAGAIGIILPLLIAVLLIAALVKYLMKK